MLIAAVLMCVLWTGAAAVGGDGAVSWTSFIRWRTDSLGTVAYETA